jgi:hypothetical protein
MIVPIEDAVRVDRDGLRFVLVLNREVLHLEEGGRRNDLNPAVLHHVVPTNWTNVYLDLNPEDASTKNAPSPPNPNRVDPNLDRGKTTSPLRLDRSLLDHNPASLMM